MVDVALVGLVDSRGWLLLQERDDRAPVDPDRWGVPGLDLTGATRATYEAVLAATSSLTR